MENKKIQSGEEDEINDSPIEQVRLTIPITDDPTLPTFTFRTWVLGPITCAALAFVQQFFDYRQNPIAVSSSCFKMLLFVLGKFMAATLPSNPVKVPGTKWTFSMNPGPFNIKEHVVVSILATTGLEVPFGTTVMGIRRIFYHKYLNFWIGLLMIMTSQILGYGFAGIFMKFLVYNPYMWYPFTLFDISFFRSLHEVEERPKRGITKLQIFVMATVASFAYATLPGYLFPSLGALSVICWFWKNSVIAQQIGSGRHGLGVGSFSLDLSAISGALVFPLSTVVSLSIGTLLLLYVITPIAYWTNSNNARLFPFSSTQLFDQSGQVYNVSKVINDNDLTFNQKAYEEYSKLYMSVLFLFSVGFDFASLAASLSHFLLFHGREVWQQFKHEYDSSRKSTEDVHNRLMKKYKRVPQWWFLTILISAIGLAILSCEGFGKQLQLPYWGILLACLLALIFILPVGVLQATTGQVTNQSQLHL